MQDDEKRLQEYELAKQQLAQVEAQLNELQKQNKILSNKLKKTTSHSADFWAEIQSNCATKSGKYGTDSIKTMVKKGKITVYDANIWGHTLLHIAAQAGAYDLAEYLVQNVLFCLL